MTILEGSHSGLVHHLGKVATGKPVRGFKSLTLRKQKLPVRTEPRRFLCIFVLAGECIEEWNGAAWAKGDFGH